MLYHHYQGWRKAILQIVLEYFAIYKNTQRLNCKIQFPVLLSKISCNHRKSWFCHRMNFEWIYVHALKVVTPVFCETSLFKIMWIYHFLFTVTMRYDAGMGDSEVDIWLVNEPFSACYVFHLRCFDKRFDHWYSQYRILAYDIKAHENSLNLLWNHFPLLTQRRKRLHKMKFW